MNQKQNNKKNAIFQLSVEIDQLGITKKEIAEKADVSDRMVHFFFAGNKYSQTVFDTTLALIQDRQAGMSQKLLDSHLRVARLLTTTAEKIPA
jgi:hypothetical protein